MTGSGTALDPWVIWDVNDLQAMANGAPYLATDYYQLAQDIDASVTVTWNAGQGFLPRIFQGHFEGNYCTITDLYIHRGTPNKGLFHTIELGATVQHLIMLGCDIADTGGNLYTACLAGQALTGSTIHRVAVEGTVLGYSGVGGMIARADNCTITECCSYGFVRGWINVGGLIGNSFWNTLSDCYSRADVEGYDAGFPHITQGIGGLIGVIGGVPIGCSNAYSTGLTTCLDPAPGCQLTAWGGFLGQLGVGSSCVACFWDTQTSGMATSNCGTGQTTAQMKTPATFTAAGWDLVTIWGIDLTGYWNDGYPYLHWYGPPTIQVVSPNGGERWAAGSTHTILWTHTWEPGANVSVELLLAGVLDETIVASTPVGPKGGGAYSWTIAGDKTPSDHYSVRISSLTTPATDDSDNTFSITVVAPPSSPQVVTLPATEVRS